MEFYDKWTSCEFKNTEFYYNFMDLLHFKIYEDAHKIYGLLQAPQQRPCDPDSYSSVSTYMYVNKT